MADERRKAPAQKRVYPLHRSNILDVFLGHQARAVPAQEDMSTEAILSRAAQKAALINNPAAQPAEEEPLRPQQHYLETALQWIPRPSWEHIRRMAPPIRDTDLIVCVYLGVLPVKFTQIGLIHKACGPQPRTVRRVLRRCEKNGFIRDVRQITIAGFRLSGLAFNYGPNMGVILDAIRSAPIRIVNPHAQFIASVEPVVRAHLEGAGARPPAAHAGAGRRSEAVPQTSAPFEEDSDAAPPGETPTSDPIQEAFLRDPEVRWWAEEHGVTPRQARTWARELALDPQVVLASLRHARWDLVNKRVENVRKPAAWLHAILNKNGLYPAPPDYKTIYEIQAEMIRADIARRERAYRELLEAQARSRFLDIWDEGGPALDRLREELLTPAERKGLFSEATERRVLMERYVQRELGAPSDDADEPSR